MILCIVGPTGIGKTRLSIALAKIYKAIIINGDAMQVYKKMNVGTAKIREEEKEGITHYLFDIVDVNENYTVYDYQKDVRKILEENKNKNIIIVGGSGMYMKAALYNYVFQEENTPQNEYQEYSDEELYKMCLEKDKNMNIHINNRKRLVRFLNKKNTENAECYPLYNALWIGLTTNRDKLYELTNKRVEDMFRDGLVEEVKNLYEAYPNSKALQTAIGYKELIEYLNGKVTIEEAKEQIKKNTRHYVKRQYTWCNNKLDVKWFKTNLTNFDLTVNEIKEYIDNRNE